MRVAHCIQGLGLGGAQQVVREIVGRAPTDGFEFFVYAAEDGFFRGLYEEAGATVRVLPRVFRRFDPQWMARLALAMRRDRIDLVHAHLFGDTLHGYLASRLAAVPGFVMTLHCDLPSQPRLQRGGYRWLLRRPVVAVACSGAAARSIARESPSTFGAVRTIANGVPPAPVRVEDPEARSHARDVLGLAADARVIGSVGRLDPDKAPELLLDAFARLPETAGPAPLLLFAGEGGLEPTLRARAERAGVADRVRFAGLRTDIRELLPGIDVVAFSSSAEGLSMALLETMAAGGCIVAADVPGNREAVGETEAVLARPGDADALADALSRAISDPALRRRLGEAARKRYRADFSADGMVAAYASLYREVETVGLRAVLRPAG